MRIRITTALTVSALLLAGPALAQDEIAPEVSEETATETGSPALWKVADEDTTIYLLSLIHI